MRSNMFKGVRRFLSDNTPAILTGLGVAGTISTAILAVQATPKAMRDIWDAESETTEELTWQEKAKLVWKHYLPSGAVAGVTVGAIIMAQSLNYRRQAALMSVYALTETAFREYRTEMIEQHGEKADQKIRDSIAERHIKENPPVESQIIITGQGDHLCYDSMSGRYFRSNIDKVRRAVNEINSTCLSDTYASQNDFYRLIGLDPIVFGEEHGWRFDNLMDVNFSSYLEPESGEPALSIEYGTGPIRGYYKING